MANDRVYIHEFIEIRGHQRARYMQHMTANWSPIAQKERNQRCYGVWGTVGSTGRWPEVVNLWEEDGWHGLARNIAFETRHPGMQDPSLAAWWAEAAKFRRGGIDRILVPAPWTRTIEELTRDGVRGEFYAHELVQVRPGTARRYLELAREVAVPLHERLGIELVGAFRTAMRNESECLLLWAIPSHERWAELEIAQERDEGVVRWRAASREIAIDWQRILLVDAPSATLRLGRQPAESDRRPLEDL